VAKDQASRRHELNLSETRVRPGNTPGCVLPK
jgi:hypothetical protein